MSGSRTVTQTGDGYNVNKQVQTQGGASKSVNKEIDTEDRSVDRSSTTTNQWGQSASRERTVEGQGGYATVEGSAKTSTGREASVEGAVGRNIYGQPAYAGTVNTKYNGNYATAGVRNPYGGYTKATVGPYGGKVTTTLPSGYRTSTYYGRPYYSYGGAYYRPYPYHGVHYYYPVPPPYYAYYSSPPVGAIIVIGGRRDVLDVEGRQLQQEDDEQRGHGGVPVGAGAAGREHQDAAGRARARHRLGHHVLPVLERVLSTGDERGAGELRHRDAAGGRRVPPGAARRLRGRPAQHDVLQRGRELLRAVPGRRRQGALRDGRSTAEAARVGQQQRHQRLQLAAPAGDSQRTARAGRRGTIRRACRHPAGGAIGQPM